MRSLCRTSLCLLVAGCSLVTPADLDQGIRDATDLDLLSLETPGGVNGCGTTTLRFTTDLAYAGEDVVVRSAIGDRVGAPVTLTLESGAGRALGTLEIDTTTLAYQDVYEASLLVSHVRSEQSGEVLYADLPESGEVRFSDADGDGAGALPVVRDCEALLPTTPDDCDDTDPHIHPLRPETIADGIDQDCDGFDLCYVDADRDGVGSAHTVSAPPQGCDALGVAAMTDDCDDDDARVAPGRLEICDGLDNDCSGALEAEEDDDDGDFYITCAGFQPGGVDLLGGDDCDDGQAEAFPGRAEQCDGIDNDCDGHRGAGEGDTDLDGFLTCEGFVDIGIGLLGTDDCAPDHPHIWPGAPEMCDGIDNDCDHLLGPTETDEDLDGYLACVTLSAHLRGGDCNDADRLVHPGATEFCDGQRNDCNHDPADQGALPFAIQRGVQLVHQAGTFSDALDLLEEENNATLHMCADAGHPTAEFVIEGGVSRFVGHGSSRPTLSGRLTIMGTDTDVELRGLRLVPTSDLGTDPDGGAVNTQGPMSLTDVVIDCAHAPGVRSGGAIYSTRGVTMSDTEIRNCIASEHGGAVYARTFVSTDSVFVGNRASFGGALSLQVVARTTGGRFEANEAVDFGGAIYVDGAQGVAIEDTDFLSNRTTGLTPTGLGGGLWLGHVSSASIVGGHWDGNQASSGGAVYASPEVVNLTLSEVGLTHNEATEKGGGLYVASDLHGHGSTGTVTGSTWFRNQAQQGGGLQLEAAGWTITTSSLIENFGGNGGGVRLGVHGGLSTDHVEFIDNQAFIGRDMSSGGTVTCTDTAFLLGNAPAGASSSRVYSNSLIQATRMELEQGPHDTAGIELVYPSNQDLNGRLDCTDCSFSDVTVDLSSTATGTNQQFTYDGDLPHLLCDAMAQTCTPEP